MSENMLADAQQRADDARAALQAAEQGDPTAPGWDERYTAALGAVRGAERRLDALTALRAAQVERSGQRDAVVKAAAKELDGLASGLAASRDQVAAAASAHLRSLSALTSAAAAHNTALAAARGRLAGLGLAVTDDLLPAGAEHPEGVDGQGARLAGTNWTPVPVHAVIVHGLLEATGRHRGPFAALRGMCPPHQTTSRPDGLKVPSLPQAAPVAVPAAVPPRATIEEARRREPRSD